MNRSLSGNGLHYDVTSERLFSGLSSEALRELSVLESPREYPRAALLFREGEPAEGIFLICSGSVKLSICSTDGEKLALRIAQPGEMLGLSATMLGTSQEVTAETIEPSQLVFIRRRDFLRYLREHTQACLQVVELLSNDVQAAYDRVRALGMVRARHSRN